MINIWILLSSMVLSVILGFVWYGPLFGKKWMELSGIKMPEEKPSMSVMIKPMLLSFIGAIFISYALFYSIIFHNLFYGVGGISAAIGTAVFLWLGFIVPTYLNLTGWEGKSWTLFFINIGYWFVFLVLISSIISAFI